MATEILWALNDINVEIGESDSTAYTLVVGQPVHIGADGDSNTNRAKPIDDASAETCIGVSRNTTAESAHAAGMITVALFPNRVRTDNVSSSVPPTADANNLVYLNDDSEWCAGDSGSTGFCYGSCLKVIAAGTYPATTDALYELDLKGRTSPRTS